MLEFVRAKTKERSTRTPGRARAATKRSLRERRLAQRSRSVRDRERAGGPGRSLSPHNCFLSRGYSHTAAHHWGLPRYFPRFSIISLYLGLAPKSTVFPSAFFATCCSGVGGGGGGAWATWGLSAWLQPERAPDRGANK